MIGRTMIAAIPKLPIMPPAPNPRPTRAKKRPRMRPIAAYITPFSFANDIGSIRLMIIVALRCNEDRMGSWGHSPESRHRHNRVRDDSEYDKNDDRTDDDHDRVAHRL